MARPSRCRILTIRIAFCLPSLTKGRGGAEKVACQVASLLAQDGHEVTIFHRDTGDPAAYPLHDAVKTVGILIDDRIGLLDYRGQFDLLIGFAMPPLYVGIAVMADIIDAPFVIQECTNPGRMVSLMLINKQEGVRTLEEAYWTRQAVLAHAAGIRLTLPSYRMTVHPEIRDRCSAFPNSFFIDHDDVRPYGSRTKRIVCVGGLKNHNKNGMALAEAFVEAGLGERGWRVEFCGKNGFEDSFAELSARAPEGTVVDVGIVSNPHEIYGDAQLLVIPSYEEGLPNVVVEAFSFGIPAIGYRDCPGVNELITAERGILVDRQEPKGLTTALTALADDEARRNAASAAALDFARRTFDPGLFADKWRQVVKHAVAGLDAEGRPGARMVDREGPAPAAMRRMLRADLLMAAAEQNPE